MRVDSLFAAHCCIVATRLILGDLVYCGKLIREHCCNAHSRMRTLEHAQTHTHTLAKHSLFTEFNLDEAKTEKAAVWHLIIVDIIKSRNNKQ